MKKVHKAMGIACIVLGIVLLVLNLTKTANPGHWTAWLIGYGFLIGPMFAVIGLGAFLEDQEEDDEY